MKRAKVGSARLEALGRPITQASIGSLSRFGLTVTLSARDVAVDCSRVLTPEEVEDGGAPGFARIHAALDMTVVESICEREYGWLPEVSMRHDVEGEGVGSLACRDGHGGLHTVFYSRVPEQAGLQLMLKDWG